MRMSLKGSYRRLTTIIISLLLVFVVGCSSEVETPPKSFIFTSYRDIPDITDDEIEAIEELQRHGNTFIYASPNITESYTDINGGIGGFTALFCDWLTEFFGITFSIEILDLSEMLEGLKTGTVSFGNLTATPERMAIYHMTDPIIHRSVKIMQIQGSQSPEEIAMSRPVRYLFMEGSTLKDTIPGVLAPGSFEIDVAQNHEDVYQKLKSGEADAYIAYNIVETSFDVYGDVFTDDFLPLTIVPVSMTAQDPALEPIISVMTKALKNGAYKYLTELYTQGYQDYKRNRFYLLLDEEEKAYLQQHPVIPFASQYNSYPLSFYNAHSKKWEGYTYDVMDKIMQLTGLTFDQKNYDMLEMTELMMLLENGEAYCIPNLMQTDDRRDRFIWSDTIYFSDRFALLSKRDFPNIEFNDIPYEKIGVTGDSAFNAVFKNWFPNALYVTEYHSHDDTFAALDRGEINLVMASQARLAAMTHYYEFSDYKANYLFNAAFESSFGFNKNQTVLRSIIDKAFTLIDTERLSEQWRSRTYNVEAMRMREQRPWLMAASILSLLVLLLVFIIFLRNKKMAVALAAEKEKAEDQAQDAMKAHQNLQILIDTMPVSVIILNADNYSVRYANSAALRDFNYSLDYESLIGRSCLEFMPEYQPDGRKSIFVLNEFFNSNRTATDMHCTKFGGEPFIARINSTKMNYNGMQVILSIIEDTTVEQEQLYAIQEAHQNLQTVLDMLPVGVGILGMEGFSVIYVNRTLVGTLGYSLPEQMIGHSVLNLMPELQPCGRRTIDIIRENFQKNISVMELRCRRQSGEIFAARISFANINYEGIPVSLGVIEDMTAEEEHRQRLKNTVLREQEANRLKSRFLANMSHEIRTPMNAIIGMTELALRENDPAVMKEHIFEAKQAGTNLLAIISDILDFSKIESGKLDIISENYSVSTLISDVVNIIRMRLVDSQLHFIMRVDRNIPETLYGDETRIRQAVLNVLHNAVKYTEKGSVSFTMYAESIDDDTINVIFEVTDTGIGIQQENIDKLFYDFTQFDIERNRGIEGVGLGLAIASSLVKEMKGMIDVASEYGKGSTFTITVPQKIRSNKALAEVEQPDKKSVLIYERREIYANSLIYAITNLGVNYVLINSGTELYDTMEGLMYDFLFISHELYKRNEETIKAFGTKTKVVILSEFGEAINEKEVSVLAMPVYCTGIADVLNGVYSKPLYTVNDEFSLRFSASGAKVLVVDDIYTNLKVVEGLLVPYHMQVDLCNSGAGAIEMIHSLHNKPSERYDLIFMDHKMPGMNGVEATRLIREKGENDPYYKEVPIIALTANVVSGMPEMFMENGFSDFLGKPIDTAKLNAILEKWIR